MKKHRKHKVGFNWHHRRPHSRGGRGGKNLVHVPVNLHRLWHAMFGNMTAEEVAIALTDTWLEDGYTVTIRKKS